MTAPAQRRVVCAANRLVISVPVNGGPIRTFEYLALGPRHFDPTMRRHIEVHIAATVPEDRDEVRPLWRSSEQGFIDQWGTFMTREEALEVARTAGQIIKRVGGDEKQLFSENLY